MFKIIFACTLVSNVLCYPIQNKIPPPEVFRFMKNFGYLVQGPEDSEALYSEEAIFEAIKNMQKFGGLPQTGIIDNSTLQLMESPRCGVPDVYRTEENRRKRYIIAAQGWQKRNITYFVANWTPKIGEEAVIKNIQLALDTWGQYSRLKFQQIHNPAADIIVAFGRGPHGDGYPFDGPGNILAHAFFPYEQGHFGGDIHFDDDENWKIKPSDYDDGVDFFTVALHELGHSLGLGHSPVLNSIMFPYYRGHSTAFALGYDDILAMYQLYIQVRLDEDKTTPEPEVDKTEVETEIPISTSTEDPHVTEHTTSMSSTTQSTITEITYAGDYETVDEHKEHEIIPQLPTTTMSPIPDICLGDFDAIGVLREELFIFKNEYVWRLRTKGIIEPGYPVRFRQLFTKFPSYVNKIDAVYQRPTDANIIFFTGNLYWVFNGDNFVDGSPLPLTNYELPRELDKIDAVQVWQKNGKTYFYRNEMFWRYDEKSKRMDPGYPHHIKRWRGVPAGLDAATTWTDGFTYFFKGRLFWKFDNIMIKTDDRYPLPAPQTWLGCPEEADTIWWLPDV